MFSHVLPPFFPSLKHRTESLGCEQKNLFPLLSCCNIEIDLYSYFSLLTVRFRTMAVFGYDSEIFAHVFREENLACIEY